MPVQLRTCLQRTNRRSPRILPEIPPRKTADQQKWWWLAVGALAIALLYVLSPILTPFVLAAILAYISQPMVLWLGRRKVPRTLAVVLVMLLVAAMFVVLLLIVLPLLVKEIAMLATAVPGWLDRLNETVAPWINAHLGTSLRLDPASLKEAITEAVQTREGLGEKLLTTLRLGGLGLLGLFANAVLVPVVMFFLMRDWEMIIARVEQLVPRAWHDEVTGFFRESDHALGQYLHGQIVVILIMCVFYTLTLWLTGLSFFLPIGVITGLLVFVPYVGAVTGFVLATLSALMQFDDFMRVVWVWVVFGVGQAIEGNFITPKFVGGAIGLHPVAVIFALLAFGQLFGFTGLLIALPASAVLLVALRKLRRKYLSSPFYNTPL